MIFDSVRVSPRRAGLSCLLSSRCFLISTAFLISARMSSGSSPAASCSARIAATRLPVTALTSGVSCSSRRVFPIFDGLIPCFASSTTFFSISFADSPPSGLGRPTGLYEAAFPRARECIRAIVLCIFL